VEFLISIIKPCNRHRSQFNCNQRLWWDFSSSTSNRCLRH